MKKFGLRGPAQKNLCIPYVTSTTSLFSNSKHSIIKEIKLKKIEIGMESKQGSYSAKYSRNPSHLCNIFVVCNQW
jgi:hypothetical protein